jgi:RecQ-mediated genome instability protein 1
VLEGQHVLQVDEMINISKPHAERVKNASSTNAAHIAAMNNDPKRMLKLALTDGTQRVFAIEYRPCAALRFPYQPGFKVTHSCH